MATTEQRMAMGGHRLADLLTTLYTSNPVPFVSAPVSQGKLGFSWSALPGKPTASNGNSSSVTPPGTA